MGTRAQRRTVGLFLAAGTVNGSAIAQPSIPEAGSGVWHHASLWTDQLVPGQNTPGTQRSAVLPSLGLPYSIAIEDAPVHLDRLEIQPGVRLTLADRLVLTGAGAASIENRGRIVADLQASGPAIYVERNTTLDGTGLIKLRYGGIEIARGSMLTQLEPHSLALESTLSGEMRNESVISAGADSSAQLINARLISPGEIRVEGELVVRDSSIDSSNGSILLNNDARLVLSNGASIAGGEILMSPESKIRISSDDRAVLDDAIFRGAGSIEIDPGAALSIGPSGVFYSGSIDLNEGSLIELSGDLRGQGQIIGQGAIAGESARIARGIRIEASSLKGQLIIEGRLSPAGNAFGPLRIDGDISLSKHGVLELDVSPGARDTVSGEGRLDLATGSGLLVRLDPDRELPRPGSVFTLIELPEVVGTFDRIAITPTSVAREHNISVRQEAGRVELVFEFCAADVNEDGSLDARDFSAWMSAFNRGDLQADANEDGRVGPEDYGAWLGLFRDGCP